MPAGLWPDFMSQVGKRFRFTPEEAEEAEEGPEGRNKHVLKDINGRMGEN